MAVPFRLDGLEALQKKLASLPKHLEDQVDAELKASCDVIVRNAKRDAPVDTGFLRNGISAAKVARLNYEVVSLMRYSAYVEFGTGLGVLVPTDLIAFAAQFKGKGRNITKGMNAQPFFFKNFYLEKPKLVARIKKIVTTVK